MIQYAAAALLGAMAMGCVFAYGVSVGKAGEVAAQVRDDRVREMAQEGAATAIAKIKVTNTTIRGEVQREIQTNTVYRDCRLPADGLRIANEALAGKRVGSRQMPRADSPDQ